MPNPIATAIPVFAAAAACLGASANISIAYISSTNYSYKITKVPDFDQRRNGLANNGNNHCVPTSAINWMAYIANHGYPNLAPGTGWWQSSSLYNTATLAIALQGVNMGTSGTSGTGLTGAVDGMKTWFNNSPYAGQFIVLGINDSEFTWTTSDTLANHALLKRLVIPRVGWYSAGSGINLNRTGGHCVSLTRALHSGSSRTLGIHDPASDDGNLSAQGTFSRENYSIAIDVNTLDGNPIPRPVSRLVGYGSGRIDGYRAIIPSFGLTTSPNLLNLQLAQVFTLGSAQPSTASFALNFPVQNLVISHDMLSALVHTNQGSIATTSTISKHNLATGEVTDLITVGGNITAMAAGRKGPVYFISPFGLFCKGTTAPDAPSQFVTPPGSPAAIVYDDANDHVILLDTNTKRLYRYPDQIVDVTGAPAQPIIVNLPSGLVFNGTPTLAVNPVTGRVWYATSANDKIFEVVEVPGAPATTNPVLLPGVGSIQSLQFDDLGRIFIGDGSVKGFLPPAAGGGTATVLPPSASPFIGMPVSKFFCIPTSRHNFDPATMSGPAQRDITLPTQFARSIPDCFADLNGDDQINGVDLGLLLQAWGTVGFSDSDLNSDGVVDGVDLGLLLQSWGACPS